MRIRSALLFALATWACAASGQDAAPNLQITWPAEGAVLPLGGDAERSVGVVVQSNFKLLPAGQCGSDKRCGHIHMKIDPEGDSCNLPGRPYNSMNSDHGGDLIKARFGACPSSTGSHVIGVLLADDHHKPVMKNGKPVTALVKVTTR
jgi:hypothetical protein